MRFFPMEVVGTCSNKPCLKKFNEVNKSACSLLSLNASAAKIYDSSDDYEYEERALLAVRTDYENKKKPFWIRRIAELAINRTTFWRVFAFVGIKKARWTMSKGQNIFQYTWMKCAK